MNQLNINVALSIWLSGSTTKLKLSKWCLRYATKLHLILLTNPSTRVGYDTRSIFLSRV